MQDQGVRDMTRAFIGSPILMEWFKCPSHVGWVECRLYYVILTTGPKAIIKGKDLTQLTERVQSRQRGGGQGVEGLG